MAVVWRQWHTFTQFGDRSPQNCFKQQNKYIKKPLDNRGKTSSLPTHTQFLFIKNSGKWLRWSGWRLFHIVNEAIIYTSIAIISLCVCLQWCQLLPLTLSNTLLSHQLTFRPYLYIPVKITLSYKWVCILTDINTWSAPNHQLKVFLFKSFLVVFLVKVPPSFAESNRQKWF